MDAEISAILAGVAVLLVLAGLVAALFILGRSKPEQEADKADENNDKSTAKTSARRAERSSARSRLRRRLQSQEEGDSGASSSLNADGNHDEDEDENSADEEEEKLTKKERRKRENEERRAAEAAAREHKAAKAAQYDARRREKEAAREAAELAEEEERKRAEAEREAAEQQEYEQWRGAFNIEEQGEDDADAGAAGADSEQSILADFVDYITQRKVVEMEELAAEFGLTGPEAAERVRLLSTSTDTTSPQLRGIIDERGRFIALTDTEMAAVAAFIVKRGRVSITDIAREASKLIDLDPKEVVARSSTGRSVVSAEAEIDDLLNEELSMQ